MVLLDYDDLRCHEESDFSDDENSKPESCEFEHIRPERKTPEQQRDRELEVELLYHREATEARSMKEIENILSTGPMAKLRRDSKERVRQVALGLVQLSLSISPTVTTHAYVLSDRILSRLQPQVEAIRRSTRRWRELVESVACGSLMFCAKFDGSDFETIDELTKRFQAAMGTLQKIMHERGSESRNHPEIFLLLDILDFNVASITVSHFISHHLEVLPEVLHHLNESAAVTERSNQLHTAADLSLLPDLLHEPELVLFRPSCVSAAAVLLAQQWSASNKKLVACYAVNQKIIKSTSQAELLLCMDKLAQLFKLHRIHTRASSPPSFCEDVDYIIYDNTDCNIYENVDYNIYENLDYNIEQGKKRKLDVVPTTERDPLSQMAYNTIMPIAKKKHLFALELDDSLFGQMHTMHAHI